MKAEKENYHLYNKTLRPLANTLRKNMTKAEACLWKYALRARTLKGYPFRRQRPVLHYIADFMCKELSLIIEVDGITHTWEETIEKDHVRQKALEQAGFTVLRFTDDDVLTDMSRVVETLENWVDEFERVHPLNPPPAGDSSRPTQ